MAMGFKPVGWTVLTELIDRPRKDGLRPPEGSTDINFKKNVVVAVGTPRITANGMELPIPVEVGDEIAISNKNPSLVQSLEPQLFGGRVFASVHCEAIMGVLNGEPDAPGAKIVRATRIPELIH